MCQKPTHEGPFCMFTGSRRLQVLWETLFRPLLKEAHSREARKLRRRRCLRRRPNGVGQKPGPRRKLALRFLVICRAPCIGVCSLRLPFSPCVYGKPTGNPTFCLALLPSIVQGLQCISRFSFEHQPEPHSTSCAAYSRVSTHCHQTCFVHCRLVARRCKSKFGSDRYICSTEANVETLSWKAGHGKRSAFEGTPKMSCPFGFRL